MLILRSGSRAKRHQREELAAGSDFPHSPSPRPCWRRERTSSTFSARSGLQQAETQDKGTTRVVKDGDSALVLGHEFSIFATPGHTLGHICYFSHPYFFCGDTLFSGGCGRLFEGTASQMYQSLKKISALPDDTLICCAHEYTLANMKFALSILPHDSFINEYYRKVNELRAKNQITLPVILKNERKNNIFLRTEDPDLINEINKETKLQQPEERFAWLRSKKDSF